MYYYLFHVFFRKIIDNNSEYRCLIDEVPTRITDQTHLLLKKYDCEYDDKVWQEMKKTSSVFKCSYKMKGLSSYRQWRIGVDAEAIQEEKQCITI